MDRGIGGPLLGPSAYFMKSPPVQYSDEEAHDLVEAFIKEDQLTIDAIDSATNGHSTNGFSLETDPALRSKP
jgi:hypothetical protein